MRNLRTLRLVRPDARFFHHRAPLHALGLDERREFLDRAARRLRIERREFRAHVFAAQDPVDRAVQCRDDRSRYAALRQDAVPRRELERDPLSRPAAYWLVIAARGTGDLDGAWNAAFTGWIRAGSQPEGEKLRADIDRFVTQTLIPERAQARTGQRLDSKATQTEMASETEQWRALSEQWRSPT